MKPGRRIFKEVRQRRVAFVRRNRWRFIAFASGWIGVGGVCVAAVAWLAGAGVAFFFAGVWITAGVALVCFALLLEGSFYRRMGGTAEEWTAAEFGKLDASQWSLFHNVEFDGFDVDHVVVGPRQVLAVETKYRSDELAIDTVTDHLLVPEKWLTQARKSQRKIRLLLKSERVEQRVTPVLVVWGPGVPRSLGPWQRLGHVVVLNGARGKQWRAALDDPPWSTEPTYQARRAIENYLTKRRRADISA